MESKKMMAIVASGYGSPEVLKLQYADRPEPGPNEILVKVKAAGATTADSMIRTGKPYFGRLFLGLSKPKNPIPGTGFSGEVVELGEDVSLFKLGDQVFGETTFGFSTNAEYVSVAETGVIHIKPENLSHAEAAPMCDGALTSFNFLKEMAGIKKGDQVLVNGASGSLGTAAVQLAKQMGAEVTAVCSGKNAGLVKSLGADHVVDYTITDFTQTGETYDFIYDTLGKRSFRDCKRALKPHGQYLSPVLKFPLLLQMVWTSVFGSKKARFAATGMKSDKDLRQMLSDLMKVVTAGKFKVIIDRQYPLEKVAEAHTYIDSGRKKGNVVIMV